MAPRGKCDDALGGDVRSPIAEGQEGRAVLESEWRRASVPARRGQGRSPGHLYEVLLELLLTMCAGE
eukprot:scaffold31357_cov54-Phaeocystis_antarctica.AAC.1